MKIDISRLYNMVITAALLIFIFLYHNKCNHAENSDMFISMYKQSHDSLRVFKNKDSLNEAKIQVITGDNKELHKVIAGKDQAIAELQKIVDKHTQTAVVLNTKTENKGATHTTVLFDTIGNSMVYNVKNDTCVTDTVYPDYVTAWNEKWSKGIIKATRDSIFHDIITFNDFDITQRLEKQKGLFKPRILMIDVVNKNPHTETVNLKSFQADPPKPRTGLKILTGTVIGAVTMFFIMRH